MRNSNEMSGVSEKDLKTVPVTTRKCMKPRRKRTAFSNIQLYFLEQFFQKKAYPTSQERNFIGSILNIGSGQVKTWYQNRRTKMKRNKEFDHGNVEAQESAPSEKLNVNFVGEAAHSPSSLEISNTFNISGNNDESRLRSHTISNRPDNRISMSHCYYKSTRIASNLLIQRQNMSINHP